MLNYIIRRGIQGIITIFIILTIIFFLLNLLPGDAALLAGDPRLAGDPEAMEAVRQKWGLDEPVHIRYLRYASNLLLGDFGVSYRTSTPVNSLIIQTIGPTIRVVSLAAIIALTVGLILGMLAAIFKNSIIDIFSMFFAIIGISVPSFWLGLLLIYFFSVLLGVLPSGGYDGGSLRNLLMPAITLSVPMLALLARTTRASVLDVIENDYVRTARSKGLKEKSVMFKHVFRNSINSITTIAGLELGVMFANTVVIEKVFSWPGMGNLIVNSIIRRDIPAVQGCIFVFALIVVLINLLVDISYAYLDPRIVYK